MKILKRITAIILATGVLLLSGCNNEVKNKENLESVLQSNQNTSDTSSDGLFEKPGRYGVSLSVKETSTEYNGEDLFITCDISNTGDAASIGVFLYVNGMQTPCKAEDDTELRDYHIINFDTQETKEMTFKFTPYNCKKGEKAEFLFTTMLKPDFMLPDATYFGFGNNHSIQSVGPFHFDVSEDSPEKEFGGISNAVNVTDDIKEIEKEYSNIDYVTGEATRCYLDEMTAYQLIYKDNYDPFFTCENYLDLTAQSVGLPQKFYAAVYIDHKIMPAFDGKCYAYFNVDRQHLSKAKVRIDTSELPEGLHHVYMRIIPVGDNLNGQRLSWKTPSKLLLKGESFIAQAQDTYDKLIAEENGNHQTESKDENTSTEDNNKDFSVLSRAVIQNITKIDENTLLAIGENNFVLADARTYEIINEIPLTGTLRIHKINNGFVTVDISYENCAYDIYDTKGNKTKHVDIPMKKLQGEELEMWRPYTEIPAIEASTLHVSTDGEKVVYFGENGFCVNSIDLGNEIILQPSDEFNGGYSEFYVLNNIILYKDDIVYGRAVKYNPDIEDHEVFFASFNTITKEWKTYHQLTDDQQIFNKDEFVDNSVIIVDAKGDDRYTEGKLYYLSIGETELKEFTCEEGYESVTAFISDNAKYILTTHTFSDFEAEIKLYDVKSGEVLLNKKVSDNALTAYIEENTRKLYVVCGTEFSALDF